MKIKKIPTNTTILVIALIICLLFSLPTAHAAGYHRPCSIVSNRGCDLNHQNQYHRHHRNYNPKSIIDQVSEIFSVPITLNSLFEQQHQQTAHIQRSTTTTHPLRYDITQSDETGAMELALDLPGVRVADVQIELLQDGKVLKVSGSRKYRQYGQVMTSEFDQMFSIDDSEVDVDRISAKLSDGVLVVSAPKLEAVAKSHERQIPIAHYDDTVHDVKEEVVNVSSDGSKKGGEKVKEEDHVSGEKVVKDIKGEEGGDDDIEISEDEDIQ